MTKDAELLILAKLCSELLTKLQTMQGVAIDYLDPNNAMYSAIAMARMINILNSINAAKIQELLERIQNEPTGD